MDVRLEGALAVGSHDLVVLARGQLHTRMAALRVGSTLDAGRWDAGPLDARGPVDARAPDASDGGLEDGPDAGVPPLCPPDPALVGCWPLDGDALDDSGRANHFTARAVSFPPGGGVLLGPGSAMGRDARAELSLLGLAFDAWIRLDFAPAFGQASIVDHEGQFEIFVTRTGRLGFEAEVLGVATTSFPSPLVLGAWHHVALVATPGTLTLYVDGRSVGSTATPGGSVNEQPLHLGEDAADGFEQWLGMIDDARLWARPLTAAEIDEAVAVGRRLE